MQGDLNRAGDAIALQPTTKPTADQMIVGNDLVQRQACGLRRRLDSRDGWLPTQTSQPSLRTCTVQFIGSIVACARNGTW
jgi:hypothetical protein